MKPLSTNHLLASRPILQDVRKSKKQGHKNVKVAFSSFASFIALLIVLTGSTGCKHNPLPSPLQRYQQVNLVADITGYDAAMIDKNLKNPWGIAIAPSGPIWISDNYTGLTTVYDATGKTLIPAITIPSADPSGTGTPTGQVFNNTSDFIIPSNMEKSRFIFDSEDGTISAWSSGNTAIIVVDRSGQGAVYKGLALAQAGTANYLYAADFKGGKIDVFDKDFKYVSGMSFNDPDIPSGFAPFNIQNIGGMLYVAYAKQKGPDNEEDQPGVGNGYVDIFKPDGSLVKRFASRGKLNSPWGIAMAPSEFGLGENAVLIGNFGDGKINVYNSQGKFKGQLKNLKGQVIAIDGLWALTFPGDNVTSINSNWLFFTAGPEDEEHGLFGYLTPMLQGNPGKPGSPVY